MTTKTKRKSDVTYWKKSGRTGCIFVLDKKQRAPTYIYDFDTSLGLQVMYDYDVSGNTYNDDPAPIQLSYAGFKRELKAIQAKYGVKFSIKTEWGTNASQSSDT